MVDAYVYHFSESPSRYFVDSSLEESSLGLGNGITAFDCAIECQSSINVSWKHTQWLQACHLLMKIAEIFNTSWDERKITVQKAA